MLYTRRDKIAIRAVFAACGLWSVKTLDKAAAIVGMISVVIVAIGLYLPGLSLLTNLWLLRWFVCVGPLLWRRSAEITLNP